MSDVVKFFDAAHRLAHRVLILVPPEIKNAILTDMHEVLMLEPLARIEHQELAKERNGGGKVPTASCHDVGDGWEEWVEVCSVCDDAVADPHTWRECAVRQKDRADKLEETARGFERELEEARRDLVAIEWLIEHYHTVSIELRHREKCRTVWRGHGEDSVPEWHGSWYKCALALGMKGDP